jgi:hypothetical protein
MADPVGEVESVLAAGGLALPEDVRRKMQSRVEENAQKNRPPVDYGPGDFGIDVAGMRERLAPYYTRFGVAPDPRFST